MTSPTSASELARRLARNAESFCRRHLGAGRKNGRYWIVGDVAGAPGRSLYVRLTGPDFGKGAAGKWTDAATGEHGDLLDLIHLNRGLASRREAMREAEAFLRLPPSVIPCPTRAALASLPSASSMSARRLFAFAAPVAKTLAELYLQRRGIDVAVIDAHSLRFHPRCFYRDGDDAPFRAFPALLAAVTDRAGAITGVHRTWLDPATPGEKAPIASPRRAMGNLLGHGVRFGTPVDASSPILVAGEGLETMMSLLMVMPAVPMIAALSANHLAAILFPASLQRLYIALDADRAGRRGMERLSVRARQAGIEVLTLWPQLGDFNEDLRRLGLGSLAQAVSHQLAPADATRYSLAT